MAEYDREIDRLRTENERLRQDAERWKWVERNAGHLARASSEITIRVLSGAGQMTIINSNAKRFYKKRNGGLILTADRLVISKREDGGMRATLMRGGVEVGWIDSGPVAFDAGESLLIVGVQITANVKAVV